MKPSIAMATKATPLVQKNSAPGFPPTPPGGGAVHGTRTPLQCATTLQDGSVIVTGGVSETHFGVAKTEIYNSTTKMWERKADMKQRRMKHSCANLWVDPLPEADGIVPSQLTPTSVLSVAVAGGICMLYFITTRCQV